jgi:hypothetical protein
MFCGATLFLNQRSKAMSRANGFMIPLNYNDWFTNGDRTNWCSTKVWWTNENIKLVGSSLGPTEAKVGETVTVQVGVQGVVPTGGDTELNVVQHAQVWACYPSPTAGKTSAQLVLPSMQSSNPAFAGTVNVFGSNPVNVSDYQNPSSAAFAWVFLSGTWTPGMDDLVPPNESLHCCLVATSAGVARSDVSPTPVGTVIAANSGLASHIDICTDPYQGQRNIAIIAISHKRTGRASPKEFGFLAASLSERPTQLVLDITEVKQTDKIDSAVLQALRGGPYHDLPLKPATAGLQGVRLSKNTYPLKGHLAKIVREAESITQAGTGLRLNMPANGIQPLLFSIELDPTQPPGSVHVFDITQADGTGKRGGIRVGAIIVP